MVCDILTLEEAKRRVCGNCIVFATLLQFKKFLKIKRKKKTRQKNFPGSLQLGPSFSIFLQWKTPGKICPHTLFLPLHLPFALPKPLWILSQMAPELAIHRIFPDLILCDLSGHVTQLTPPSFLRHFSFQDTKLCGFSSYTCSSTFSFQHLSVEIP